MLKLNIQSSRKNEKGIALIFSLIFLSLLLILALSFALDSMFDQKAAYNSANASSAGLLAKTQLNQIITLIENGEANYDTNSRLYSHDATPVPGYVEHNDMLDERFKNDVDTTAGWFTNIKWNYIRKGNAATDQIIGRTAFIVVPDDKLPLDSLISPNLNESLQTEERIGKYVSEINVQSAVSSSTAADVMNWKYDPGTSTGFTNGKYTGLWGSYDELITEIKNFDSTFALEDKVEENLSLEINEDREAFWGDKNNDGVWDDGEYFRRFNLTRTDWDTPAASGDPSNTEDLKFIREQILLDSGGSGTPTEAMQSWLTTDTFTTKVSGLPWIATFGYDSNTGALVDKSSIGRFDSVYDQRCQIAANLKDYCDSDDRPTSDIDPASWSSSSTMPTFTGNERTPYINKVGIQVEVSRGMSGTSSPYQFWATFDIQPYVELINIFPSGYDTTFLESLKIKVVGRIVVTIEDLQSIRVVTNETINFSSEKELADGWNAAGGTGYKFMQSTVDSEDMPDAGTTYTNFSGSASNPSIRVTLHKVIIDKVVLYNKSGEGYDYVKQLTEGSNSSGAVDINTGSQTYWFGWAVHDPRQNLNQGDWIFTGYTDTDDPTDVLSLDGTAAPYTSKPNCLNSTYGGGVNTDDPNAGGNYRDPENCLNSDIADGALSTAYIRNAPMESPWELGYIHRGFKWETLNLKKYDANKGVKTIALGATPYNYLYGGAEYNLGDANILDQVKMTAEAKSPEKINLRSNSYNNVLKALFYNVQYGCPLGTASSGTKIDGTVAENYGSSIKGKYSSSSITEADMRTRASVVDVLTLPGGVTGYDAMQEEIIGKVINLTKIEELGGSGFTVYILAQTIKDIGGVGDTINIRKFSEDETPGDKDCEIGVFDADTSNLDSKKHIYFDEITAEQKIKVKGSISGGKVKITSFQYID